MASAENLERRKVGFRFHPNLIDRLGSGLYDTTAKAIAELVANAHDAQAPDVTITYPETWSPESKIVVAETGHGTTIELTRLSDEIVPMTQDQLIEDLSYEFSQIPDFSIYVNDVLVRYGFKGQIWERIPLNGEVPGYGPYAGEIIIARRPREVKFPGLVVLGRGRRLDGPTTFGWGIRSHGGKMYAYITGWVEADWLTPGTDQARAG